RCKLRLSSPSRPGEVGLAGHGPRSRRHRFGSRPASSKDAGGARAIPIWRSAMRATLTTEELSAQVLFWHMGLQSRSQRIPERAEPFEVERLVAKLASKIYDTVQADEREIIEAARRAGMAIYMMAGYGFDFLEVCWRVGEREAQILRRVTRMCAN